MYLPIYLMRQRSCSQRQAQELQYAHFSYASRSSPECLHLQHETEQPGRGKGEARNEGGAGERLKKQLPGKRRRGCASSSCQKCPYPLFKYRRCSATPQQAAAHGQYLLPSGNTTQGKRISQPALKDAAPPETNFRRASPAFRSFLG